MKDSTPTDVRTAYCSCCLGETDHCLYRDVRIGRSEYRCQNCHATTVACFAVGCNHMVALPRCERQGGSRWWCAEHNGDIASFANLEVKLADLTEWNGFFKRDAVNLAAATKTALSAGVAHSYYRQVNGYEVRQLRNAAARGVWGRRKTVVFVNGWLQEADKEFADWKSGTEAHFGKASAYGVIWESGWPVEALAQAVIRSVVANPWHVAFRKSRQVGILNAEMLARYTGRPVTLMGHSLGARTILFTLLNLADKPGKPIVRDVYLFGGAADSSRKDWKRAAQAVAGTLYNFHSNRDAVLGKLLPIANAGFTKPIGTTPIRDAARNIVNVDCSDLVGGHDEYKSNLQELLSRARKAGPSSLIGFFRYYYGLLDCA